MLEIDGRLGATPLAFGYGTLDERLRRAGITAYVARVCRD